MNKKGILIAVLIFLILMSVAATGYYYFTTNKTTIDVDKYINKDEKQNSDVKKEKQSETSENADNKTQPKDETADWKTYRNEKYGFEMKYPPDWPKPNTLPGFDSKIIFRRDKGYDFLDLTFFKLNFPEFGNCKEKPVYDYGKNVYVCLTGKTFFLGDGSILGVEYKYFYKDYPDIVEQVLIVKDHNLEIQPSPFNTNYPSQSDFPVLKQILSTFKFTK